MESFRQTTGPVSRQRDEALLRDGKGSRLRRRACHDFAVALERTGELDVAQAGSREVRFMRVGLLSTQAASGRL